MLDNSLIGTSIDWHQLLNHLPTDAHEAIIRDDFVQPLLKELGFTSSEYCPEFPTGTGEVDYAARKNTDNDIFKNTKNNPYLLIEVKGRQTQAGATIIKKQARSCSCS